jgi:hypothetical protein
LERVFSSCQLPLRMRILLAFIALTLLVACKSQKEKRMEKLYQELKREDSLRNFETSLRLADSFILLSPKDPYGFIFRSRAKAGLGDSASALIDADSSLAISPTAWGFLQRSWFEHDPKQIIQYAHAALGINKESELAFAMLTMMYCDEIVIADSAVYYARLIEKKKTENTACWMALQNVYLKYGTPGQLIYACSKIIQKEPELPYPYNNRGYAKIKTRDFAGARTDIFYSLTLDSNNSYAYKNLGLLFIALNQKDSSCLYLQKAKEKKFRENYGNEVDSLIATHCR